MRTTLVSAFNFVCRRYSALGVTGESTDVVAEVWHFHLRRLTENFWCSIFYEAFCYRAYITPPVVNSCITHFLSLLPWVFPRKCQNVQQVCLNHQLDSIQRFTKCRGRCCLAYTSEKFQKTRLSTRKPKPRLVLDAEMTLAKHFLHHCLNVKGRT